MIQRSSITSGISSSLTSSITSGMLSGMTDDEKVRENRLRRMAARQGLTLQKSRARDNRSLTYGTYWLLDASTRGVVAGDTQQGYGLSLDDVETALTQDR